MADVAKVLANPCVFFGPDALGPKEHRRPAGLANEFSYPEFSKDLDFFLGLDSSMCHGNLDNSRSTFVPETWISEPAPILGLSSNGHSDYLSSLFQISNYTEASSTGKFW
jgi:hypothetical protein